ncbi:helix-turn-helix transcriptional regulator [Pedobacter sp. ISL-68]|uniref:helix-turn-helix transcriptional regulator n=1 Tax=unclassified Pedobacter TaxID=2628915 RepID=UPI001BE6D2FD|nr:MULTISPECIES: helix-turn-helix transcriptional regulator [unclassified Pedobacter]MBT2560082.1 helix-turn-helix transcriptional regulator [Pedobacter sp. ISL-64]MBT2589061.1 helix-turn-helix transcriptional regulator [Pedobacter sp. ISL-68]
MATQIHIVTLICIGLETVMLIWQIARYFYRPQDAHQGKYCLLLFLLVLFNISIGFLPNAEIQFPVQVQIMITNATGFLLASYFPYYFYREFELVSIRWHATRGVFLFLLLPYLFFYVILSSINGQLEKDTKYGSIIPTVYFFVILWDILKAIRQRYERNRQDRFYAEEMMVYCAVLPWSGMTFLSWLQAEQFAFVLCANLGFIIITLLFFVKSARRARLEYMQKAHITIGSTSLMLFYANCLHYNLTRTETLIIQRLYEGMTNKEIAVKMDISEETVKKHIQNIFRKTKVKNRAALIHKLQNNQR